MKTYTIYCHIWTWLPRAPLVWINVQTRWPFIIVQVRLEHHR